MNLLVLLVGCTLLALCSAMPSLSHEHKLFSDSGPGYFDSEGAYRAGIMQASRPFPEQQGVRVCQSAIHNINGSISTYVHVCEAGRDSDSKGNYT